MWFSQAHRNTQLFATDLERKRMRWISCGEIEAVLPYADLDFGKASRVLNRITKNIATKQHDLSYDQMLEEVEIISEFTCYFYQSPTRIFQANTENPVT